MLEDTDVCAFMFFCLSLSLFALYLWPSLYFFISDSFSAGRVSFLGVTMATMGSPYPFQSPHRFTTTSAWSKTSSSQVKRALHSEWKHILNIPPWNSRIGILIHLPMLHRNLNMNLIWNGKKGHLLNFNSKKDNTFKQQQNLNNCIINYAFTGLGDKWSPSPIRANPTQPNYPYIIFLKTITGVCYNVHAAKAERNSATHLNQATRSIYPLKVQTAAQRKLIRADAFTRW